MPSRMQRFAWLAALIAVTVTPAAHPQTTAAPDQLTPQQQQLRDKLNALHWVPGPATETVAGNSTLVVPAGYVYLDASDTAKFEELNENVPSGKEVMIAPRNLSWTAYLLFDDAGYVKDDEKIDAPALLKALQAGTERENEERAAAAGGSCMSPVGRFLLPTTRRPNDSNGRLT